MHVDALESFPWKLFRPISCRPQTFCSFYLQGLRLLSARPLETRRVPAQFGVFEAPEPRSHGSSAKSPEAPSRRLARELQQVGSGAPGGVLAGGRKLSPLSVGGDKSELGCSQLAANSAKEGERTCASCWAPAAGCCCEPALGCACWAPTTAAATGRGATSSTSTSHNRSRLQGVASTRSGAFAVDEPRRGCAGWLPQW